MRFGILEYIHFRLLSWIDLFYFRIVFTIYQFWYLKRCSAVVGDDDGDNDEQDDDEEDDDDEDDDDCDKLSSNFTDTSKLSSKVLRDGEIG